MPWYIQVFSFIGIAATAIIVLVVVAYGAINFIDWLRIKNHWELQELRRQKAALTADLRLLRELHTEAQEFQDAREKLLRKYETKYGPMEQEN